jgi:hypothetical protein
MYIAGIMGNGDGEIFSSPSPFMIVGIKVPHTRPLIDEFPAGLRGTEPHCHLLEQRLIKNMSLLVCQTHIVRDVR